MDNIIDLTKPNVIELLSIWTQVADKIVVAVWVVVFTIVLWPIGIWLFNRVENLIRFIIVNVKTNAKINKIKKNRRKSVRK